jgi:hypothetical protein
MCARGLDMLQQNKIIHGNHQKIWIHEVQEQEIWWNNSFDLKDQDLVIRVCQKKLFNFVVGLICCFGPF